MKRLDAPARPAHVLLAVDDAFRLEEIRLALEQSGAFSVCAAEGDAAGAVAAAIRARPDICLLDVGMPGDGVAAAWEIHARLPETKVVMVTVSECRDDLFESLRAGAVGYLPKDLDPGGLPRVLEHVLAGEVAIPRALEGVIVEEFRDRQCRRRALIGERPGATLTSREWQVFELLRQGLTTAQIGQRLVISLITVRTHANSILRKLHVETRARLLRDAEDR